MVYVMFFTICAAAARGGPGWTIAMALLWFTWTMTLTFTNPLYKTSGEGIAFSPDQPAWQDGE